MKIVWGLILVAMGIAYVKYTFTIVQTFGRINWAEGNLPGGTYTLHKIIGILLIFLGFLYMFGGIGILTHPFEPLFSGQPNKK